MTENIKDEIIDNAGSLKRNIESDEDDDDDICGPKLEEAFKPKKAKTLPYESVYLANLPSAKSYESSYMHRDVINNVHITRTDFIITTSIDGQLKFWKKCEGDGIEFVKHYRCHLNEITVLATSYNGEFCCTTSDDMIIKVFDITNFDMIHMLKLTYVAQTCAWIYSAGDPIAIIAVVEKDNHTINLYDSRGNGDVMHTLDKLHYSPVTIIQYNAVLKIAISCDSTGMVEYWSGYHNNFSFPKNIDWQYKTDTDLFEFVKCKTVPLSLCISDDGQQFVTFSNDRKIRLFRFITGKLIKIIDESIQKFSEIQQLNIQISNMEYGRRTATEKELEKSDQFHRCNIVFDTSGNFIIYSTMIGIKIVNLKSNKCCRILGHLENARFISLALFQGTGAKAKAAITMEMEASDNPVLQAIKNDPILFCAAFKKNRFYLFTSRDPADKDADNERDIFNEKPSKEEMISATQDISYTRISDSAVIHTSYGDIHIKLFPKECPKTVENFCVHGRNGYFNSHLIHRIIKGFMIQMGDPLGNGTGGESIWGGEFEDEFHANLKHDHAYTLSMANAGPNTNGSQFFITLVPTPWLDRKHTVFGRVVKGMDVVQKISLVKTNPKTDKPHDDIFIVSVTVK